MLTVEYSKHFERLYKKLSNEIKLLAEKKEQLFKSNPFDLHLKTHKLSGRLERYYSFSINHSHRVIFQFVSKSKVRFHEIGTHDIYE